MEAMVPNPGQPTIGPGATGDVVRRLQRALRRTPDLGISVDGVFGPQLEAAVKSFQEGAGLLVDGIVGPLTWNALPDGGPMPVLREDPPVLWFRACRGCSPMAPPVSGEQLRKGSTAFLARTRKRRSRPSKPGVVSQSTGSSGTRPGRCLCMQRVPPWRLQWASIS